jgi:hypothetical protein
LLLYSSNLDLGVFQLAGHLLHTIKFSHIIITAPSVGPGSATVIEIRRESGEAAGICSSARRHDGELAAVALIWEIAS